MKTKYNIQIMNNIAANKYGRCLSDSYFGLKSKLRWQCSLGHKWEACPSSIIYSKSWCPICAGNKKLDIKSVQQIALLNGGKCLSEEYHNSKEKLLWQCEKGHKWYASVFSIKNRSSWCPECYKNVKIKITSHEKFSHKV